MQLAYPIPSYTFPTLQPHVDMCGEGLGWLFSISPEPRWSQSFPQRRVQVGRINQKNSGFAS